MFQWDVDTRMPDYAPVQIVPSARYHSPWLFFRLKNALMAYAWMQEYSEKSHLPTEVGGHRSPQGSLTTLRDSRNGLWKRHGVERIKNRPIPIPCSSKRRHFESSGREIEGYKKLSSRPLTVHALKRGRTSTFAAPDDLIPDNDVP